MNPVAGAAEAAETLRPDGRLAGARLGQPGPLAVCWNVQEPPPDVAEAVSEVYRRVLSARRSTPPAWARTR